MANFRELAASYRTALHYAWPFTVVHLAIQLLVSAVLVPLGGMILAAAIATSDQAAFTDQEIAGFLFTPAGFAAALALVSLQIVGAVLDVAIMSSALHKGVRTAHGALALAVSLAGGLFVPILRFAARLVVRVLLMAAPFLAASAAVAWLALSRYDINYYLTYWPPSFLFAAGLIALVALAMAVVLIMRLSGWALALHLILFRRERPRRAFRESSRLLQDRRRHVVALVAGWVVVRGALAAAVSGAAGFLIGTLPGLLSSSLSFVAVMTIAFLLLWMLAGAVVAAVSNGALAALLNRLYARVSGGDAVPPVEVERGAAVPVAALLAAAAFAVGGGLAFSGQLLEGVAAERTVEIIAHRGAAAARPENTMAAVTKALEDGADWIEIDVQETADGEVVVTHDRDLMKLGGVDIGIWEATTEDLAGIDIGSWFDPAYAAERTPTLHEVLDAVKGRAKVLIELKYYGHDVDLEERVARIVEEAGVEDGVAISSLKYAGVVEMKSRRPEWRYGLLAARAIGGLATLDVDFLAVNTGQVSLGLIAEAHAQGKQVYVWTVDDPVTMSRMISMGVDGLITNEPALAREVMEARNELSVPERLSLWLMDRFRIGRFDLVAPEANA